MGQETLPSELDAIAAIDKDNVFFSSGPEIIHWNGTEFKKTLRMSEYRNSEYYSYNRTVWMKNDTTIIQGDHNGNLIFTDGYHYEYFDTGIRANIYKIWGAPKLNGSGYDIFGL